MQWGCSVDTVVTQCGYIGDAVVMQCQCSTDSDSREKRLVELCFERVKEMKSLCVDEK